MGELKARALAMLRELRAEHGNCYHGIHSLAVNLNCTREELFDWDNDSGVLLELCDEGEVHRIGSDSFIAEGQMTFGK